MRVNAAGFLTMAALVGVWEALVRFQVAALAAVAPLGYLKAHGALYHYCQSRPEAAERLVRVAADFGIGVMGQPGYADMNRFARLFPLGVDPRVDGGERAP